MWPWLVFRTVVIYPVLKLLIIFCTRHSAALLSLYHIMYTFSSFFQLTNLFSALKRFVSFLIFPYKYKKEIKLHSLIPFSLYSFISFILFIKLTCKIITIIIEDELKNTYPDKSESTYANPLPKNNIVHSQSIFLIFFTI